MAGCRFNFAMRNISLVVGDIHRRKRWSDFVRTIHDKKLEKHIPDLHVLITTPFHSAYVTAERIKRAKNMELLLTAGVGSDHIDLKAVAAAVAEVTGSNVVSVAEDELMRILTLVRNFLPGAYDLEGKTVGTVGAGRIGKLLLQRLKPFNCDLLYHDRVMMDSELANQTGAKFEEDLDAMLPKCDIIAINMPLTEKTKGMFDTERIAKCKKGVLIVNNARAAIMDTQAVVDACSSGQIAGYGGDVWDPQPASMALRYAAGVKDMLERYFKEEEFPRENYIVKEGKLAGQYL
ncbi:unnamed protein product [Ilex paraguariensis]|uniref:Formate dehydrogenase n=1 Tax=Ilex paraguariensis TaxID=185542 RepID=A0ABC8T2V3_9AQUA